MLKLHPNVIWSCHLFPPIRHYPYKTFNQCYIRGIDHFYFVVIEYHAVQRALQGITDEATTTEEEKQDNCKEANQTVIEMQIVLLGYIRATCIK